MTLMNSSKKILAENIKAMISSESLTVRGWERLQTQVVQAHLALPGAPSIIPIADYYTRQSFDALALSSPPVFAVFQHLSHQHRFSRKPLTTPNRACPALRQSINGWVLSPTFIA